MLLPYPEILPVSEVVAFVIDSYAYNILCDTFSFSSQTGHLKGMNSNSKSSFLNGS